MKFTKRIVLSVLTLVITVFALGTGVFAWFTINNTASASNLSGNVESATGGFYVSLDGSNWDTKVELNKEQHKVIGGSFTDLTSTNGFEFAKLNGDSHLTGFIKFDLYFLLGSTFSNVELSSLEIKSALETSWISEVDYENTDKTIKFVKGQPIKGYVSDAARVSIQDTTENTTSVANIFENPSSTSNTEGFDTNETNKALLYMNALKGGAAKTIPTTGVPTTVKASNAMTASIATATQLETGNKVNGHDVTPELLGQNFNKFAKVTVRVWIEGWDGEAFNAIMGGQLIVDFKFTAK